MINLFQPLAHIVAEFRLDGKKYEVERFKANFTQPVDYKGQPQHEVRGGQLKLTLAQMADDNLYLWAKQPTLLKSGAIVFKTEMSSPVLTIEFQEAYCISLHRETDAMKGSTVSLVISPEITKLNGVEHNNFWKR